MKLFSKSKDGGQESTVTAYWLIEWKSVFSIVLLKFEGESREAYHNHAFNSASWLLKGILVERIKDSPFYEDIYIPSFFPIITRRNTYHKVHSIGTSWVLSFRGPWARTWKETTSQGERTLTHGRVEVV